MRYRVTDPEGKQYYVTPPPGVTPTREELIAQIQKQKGAAQAAPITPPQAPQGGLVSTFVKELGSGAIGGAEFPIRAGAEYSEALTNKMGKLGTAIAAATQTIGPGLHQAYKLGKSIIGQPVAPSQVPNLESYYRRKVGLGEEPTGVAGYAGNVLGGFLPFGVTGAGKKLLTFAGKSAAKGVGEGLEAAGKELSQLVPWGQAPIKEMAKPKYRLTPEGLKHVLNEFKPRADGIIPKTELTDVRTTRPGLLQSAWTGLKDKFPQYLSILKQRPTSSVITISQQRGVHMAEDMQKLMDQPWSSMLYKFGNTEEFLKKFEQWEVNGFKDAPKEIQEARKYLDTYLRPLEKKAATFLKEKSLTDEPYYWPHISDRDASQIVKLDKFETGLVRDIRTTLGMFEKTRVYKTMLEGRLHGITYADPREAFLTRVWTGFKMIHTANYIQDLEAKRVIFRTYKAARENGTKLPVKIEGIPGNTEWYSSRPEALFIKQQLADPKSGTFAAIGQYGNSILRNPNLINPIPHLVRNMAYKYFMAGGSPIKLVPDMQEFLKNKNPELIRQFKSVMPFEFGGRTSTDILRETFYKMNHPVLHKITNDYNLIWKANKYSAKTIFTRWDPAIKYARWKQYVKAGMNPQEAANHVNVDLIDYGMRSEIVDWWKSVPLNFFVPWRVGTFQSFVKNARQHPIRSALFIGSIDIAREIIYRNTGWWVHLPIDYIEAPISYIIRESQKGFHKFDGAVGQIGLTSAMFGPGGQGSAYLWGQALKTMHKGSIDWQTVKNMFWGWAFILDPYGGINEMKAFEQDGDPKHLQKLFTQAASSVLLGAHKALSFRPKRLGEFIPETIIPKSQTVATAEKIQSARERARDIRQAKPARPKLEEILR